MTQTNQTMRYDDIVTRECTRWGLILAQLTHMSETHSLRQISTHVSGCAQPIVQQVFFVHGTLVHHINTFYNEAKKEGSTTA